MMQKNCETCSTDHVCAIRGAIESCGAYRPPVFTNHDWLKTLGVEEMADYLESRCFSSDRQKVLDWLKAEREGV